MTIEVGLSQLSTGSPAWPPAGTRPEAMPPATAPMQNGTSTDESANAAAEDAGGSAASTTDLRNAKLAPRRTMPRAAMVSGTNSVSMIEAYAVGNAVQVTTKMKISQTWLASQTGPIERSISRARPRAALRAAGGEVPEAGAEVGAAEHGVRREGEQQDDRDRGRSSAPLAPRAPALGARPARSARTGRRGRRTRRPGGTAGSSPRSTRIVVTPSAA